MKALKIVSRKSKLALIQAEIVRDQLLNIHRDLKIEIIGISTSGDEILDQPLNKIGGKGLFVKELENCLLQQRADIAVHSMKDMPAELPPGLALGAILQRADPNDVFCSEKYNSLHRLPLNATIGTSSLRRAAQILVLRKDLQVSPLRGNVETRLNKLKAGEFDAIILAAAGLTRLNLSQSITATFTTEQILPAVGQGALGIEYRIADREIAELIAPLNDAATAACIRAERTMNAVLDGGCQAPVAGFAQINSRLLTLRGLVASADGTTIYKAQATDAAENAIAIGNKVAQDLIAQGAAKIITELKLMGQLGD